VVGASLSLTCPPSRANMVTCKRNERKLPPLARCLLRPFESRSWLIDAVRERRSGKASRREWGAWGELRPFGRGAETAGAHDTRSLELDLTKVGRPQRNLGA